MAILSYDFRTIEHGFNTTEMIVENSNVEDDRIEKSSAYVINIHKYLKCLQCNLRDTALTTNIPI